jgi:hypothetical protein
MTTGRVRALTVPFDFVEVVRILSPSDILAHLIVSFGSSALIETMVMIVKSVLRSPKSRLIDSRCHGCRWDGFRKQLFDVVSIPLESGHTLENRADRFGKPHGDRGLPQVFDAFYCGVLRPVVNGKLAWGGVPNLEGRVRSESSPSKRG